MASKALKVVGIGCGLFALLGVVGVIGAGYWAKGKMEGMAEWSKEVEAQEKELASLNTQFSFKAPAEGEPLALDEDRLSRYFSVRKQLEPVLTRFETESKKFEKKDGEQASFGEAMSAVGLMGKLMSEMRGAYIEQLKKAKMSPAEFQAVTTAVLTSGMGAGNAEGEFAAIYEKNAKLLEGYKAELENQKTVGLDALLATNDSM